MKHFIPFVAVGGISKGRDPETEKTFEFNRVIDTEISSKIASSLEKRSSQSGPWLPGAQRLSIKVLNGLSLPPKVVPSNLSPRNPDSPLYPDGIFTDQWIQKYTDRIPTTVLLFVSLKDSNEDIETQVEDLRMSLRAARSHISVVADATGCDDDINARLVVLRRLTGLAPRTGLVCVDETSDASSFVDSLWSLLIAQAADFFAARSRETRHKRASREPEDNEDLWEARYTLKLAYFAELKADYEGAIRLYQSAYDCLLVLDSAKDLLSICAQKIYLFCIYYQRYPLAWRRFQQHLELSRDPQWLAQQYIEFATILTFSTVEGWGVAPSSDYKNPILAVPRPGFLFLTAANMATDIQIAIQSFESAIKDFDRLAHCKSIALARYGDWLIANGRDAKEVYQQSLAAMPRNSTLHEEIANKLIKVDSNNSIAKFILFYVGKGDLPEDAELGAIETPLFDIEGTFMVETAFIGRPLKCQLTLKPNFPGTLTLESIKVQFSCENVRLTHDPSTPIGSLSKATETNLTFSNGERRTFEFSVWPTEATDCEFVDVQIHGTRPSFDQRLLVTPSSEIIGDMGMRHLWIAPKRFVEVQTRPQRLTVDTTAIPSILCAQERASFKFSLLNEEDETAMVKITAMYSLIEDSDGAGGESKQFFEAQANIAASKTHEFSVEDFDCPSSAFKIDIKTEYTTESNVAAATNTVSADIDVIKPFRVNFSLSAELNKEQWPNLFVPSDHCSPLPLIRRRWCLETSIMNMCSEPIFVHDRAYDCTSNQALITALQRVATVNKTLGYNDQTGVQLHFEATRKDRDIRNFEAGAVISITWSRASQPETKNKYTVPKVRISLPNQEPRVILCVDNDHERGCLKLQYYVENATSHVLNFAVSMASTPTYIIQGMRATNLRLLPFSRQCLEYVLLPCVNPAGKPLPELRVFDTTYKKVLGVVSDSDNVYSEKGVLFLKNYSLPF